MLKQSLMSSEEQPAHGSSGIDVPVCGEVFVCCCPGVITFLKISLFLTTNYSNREHC
jgi:hypothetical protein